MKQKFAIAFILNLFFVQGLFVASHYVERPEVPEEIINELIIENVPEPESKNYKLSNPAPDYLSYDLTIRQLQIWCEEAPGLTEMFTYGNSTRGTELHGLKVSNRQYDDKKRVLITACIHGDEPWSSAVVMSFIGNLLDQYGDDERITNLIDSHDLYFVPIISPDSYPTSRFVDGVDPNRNFPSARNPNFQSIAPVAAMQKLFKEIKPHAVLSGHTYGRVYFYPYGDRYDAAPHDADYVRITKEMGKLSNYKILKASNNYNRPMIGTELDWYYRFGAWDGEDGKRGAFSIVMEYGTHQRIPKPSEIKSEFARTKEAILYFCEQAPLVDIRWN